jgi:LysR family transcriptional regulator of beta-lactamase
MLRSHLPLNALHAFEASARHLSFTRAGLELRVTQAAVSHQVKSLERILGVTLFRRLPRGLALTDEGQALVPVLTEAFGRIRATLDQFEDGHFREVVTVGTVGTLATGWLLPRLSGFADAHPRIDLRILTNNNRVDIAGEGLDYAIRFGDGSWHGTDATLLFAARFSPICAPMIADRLRQPSDLSREILLRSYRADEWPRWFAAAGVACPPIRGAIFDSSITMADAAAQGAGVALLPVDMFGRELQRDQLAQPFDIEIDIGSYWLTSLKSKRQSPGMQAFRAWLLDEAAKAQRSTSADPRNRRAHSQTAREETSVRGVPIARRLD